jgi:hypothetical protein
MKPLILSLALTAALANVSAASAHEHHTNISCSFDSRYDVQLTAEALRFARESSTPHQIEMHHGVLRVDGKEVAMSEADHTRIAEFEAKVRHLVPQVKAIARDAADIAYTAVGEVANAFAGDRSELRGKLDRMRSEVRARIEASFDTHPWNEKQFDAIVESTVQEMIPALVGEVTSMAIKAALSGDESVAQDIEKRANRLESEIEQRVEIQSRQIEARAEALCPQLVELSQLESSLELRLPDGSRLDLLDVRR